MSEQLLKAIIRLFILLAKVGGISEFERDTIRNFLNERLNQETALKYLKFLQQVETEYAGLVPGAGMVAQQDPYTQEIIRVANQINNELAHPQKIVLMLDLVTLMVADNVVEEKEVQVINTIRQAIRVDQADIDDLTSFAMASSPGDFNQESFLIISSHKNGIPGKARYLPAPNLDGILTILSLRHTANMYFIKYYGKSSVYLNNTLLRPGIIRVVPVGSALRIQNVNPIYYSDILNSFRSGETKTKLSFIAEKIEYKFPGGKTGLRGIHIKEEAGTLVGLMGSSGAGKSTLLNILNGNDMPSNGQVLINGIDIHKEKRKVEGLIGYVPQDDLLIEDLTVYQNLYYAAKLCFSEYGEEKLNTLITLTLSNLGLSETRDLRVGSPLDKKISGGQRKRLNIGLELLREPAVMFVDEPTSGLSSRDSENIMDLLKELSLKGKLVFVVIHQPSSEIFKMFDRLVILDVGGYQIFYGNPLEAAVYFKSSFNLVDSDQGACFNCGNVNVEQIFDIIETRVVDEFGKITHQRKVTPAEWFRKFSEKVTLPSIEPSRESLESTLNIPGRIAQFRIFSVRDFLSKISNTQYLMINLLEAPLLAFLLAYIIRFFPNTDAQSHYTFAANVNIPAYIFMSVIVALFMGLTVSAEEIIRDRKILKRESFLNLSRGSYLASKLFILFSLSAIQTLTFVLIGNAILEVKGMILPFWVILFSTSCFANVLGLNISSSFNSAITVYILIPILLIPQLILSGVVVKFDELNPRISAKSRVPIIGEVMTSRWAFEAAMVTQFKDNRYERNFYAFDRRMSNAEYKNLYYIPALLSKLDDYGVRRNDNSTAAVNAKKYDLTLLRSEIGKELDIFGESHFPGYSKLTPERFDEAAEKGTREFLEVLKKVYIKRLNEEMNEKDNLISRMTDTPAKRAAYDKLKEDNRNERVEETVENSNEAIRITEQNGKLIQKIYPIFLEVPRPRNWINFRTVFYAPEKFFMGRYIDTLWFNAGFIWFMSIVLILTLYYDTLRWMIEKTGSFFNSVKSSMNRSHIFKPDAGE